MRGQFLCFISILLILNLVCITNSRPFAPQDDHHTSPPGAEQFTPISPQTTTPPSLESLNKVKGGRGGGGGGGGFEEEEEEKENSRGEIVVSRIGSSPPSCEHKCYGCMPCEAIQVPTTTTSRVGVQFANYEPEGWKCKCGPSFYSP